MKTNLLNDYYLDIEEKIPNEYIDFCKKELSSKVNLYHDYDLYEWTLIVLK